MTNIKVGIIGGSGFDDPNLFKQVKVTEVTTQFGNPSDVLTEGFIGDVPCVILPRHGKKHLILPSEVNYRANIWALKEAGCTHILATCACGSLQEHAQPGDFLVLDQFFDRTTGREVSFYGSRPGAIKGVLHMPMADPFCEETRQVLIEAAKNLSFDVYDRDSGKPEPKHPCVHTKGSLVTINGPRFSTRFESKVFRSWGLDLVGMTLVPEVSLAREAGLSYASLAIVTDYDCWKADEAHVSVDIVLREFGKSIEKVKKVVLEAVRLIGTRDWTKTIEANQLLVQNSRQDLAHAKDSDK
ncbi:unnamed protein product [Trichobilharzia szidati]|nr:unnamed protein product [Trichobilharzia szidati]